MREPYTTVPADTVYSVPWLDLESERLMRAVVAAVAARHRELVAAILYGSVARRQARPPSDPDPSDIDLLLYFDFGAGQDRISADETLAICESEGYALDHNPDSPREIRTVLATGGLADWDETFVANVARDGILLWSRGPLPAALAPVEARAAHDMAARRVPDEERATEKAL